LRFDAKTAARYRVGWTRIFMAADNSRQARPGLRGASEPAALRVALLATVLAGCGAAEVPFRVSWDADVLPILQGSCGHCHGSTVKLVPGASTRFDLCSVEAVVAAGIPTLVDPALFGAARLAGTFAGYVTVQPGQSRPQMPPPPAPPLDDYQSGVLLKWARYAMAAAPAAGQPHPACAKQIPNREPRAVLVRRTLSAMNELEVTVQVSDPDREQVLGTITAGSAEPQLIHGAGRHVFLFPGAPMTAPVKVTLHDGYVARPILAEL
jgi:hypothetical protein